MNNISLGLGLQSNQTRSVFCGVETPAPFSKQIYIHLSRVGCAIAHLPTITLRGHFDKSRSDFGVLLHTLRVQTGLKSLLHSLFIRNTFFMGLGLQSNQTRSVSSGTEVPAPLITALPRNAYRNYSLFTIHYSLPPKEGTHA